MKERVSASRRRPAAQGFSSAAPHPAIRLLPAAVVAAAVLAAFLPTLQSGFAALDDDVNFRYNLGYRGLGARQLGWMFTSRLLGHYIPLTWMSCGLDYLVWGMNPFGYHLTNVALHLLNSLLLLHLARTVLRRVWPSPADGGAVSLGALAAALAFAVHPLRVESVAWITERRDVLCGCFVLLVLLLYVAAAAAAGRRRRWLLAGSWMLYALALLAKGIAVALPVSLFALDAVVPGLKRRDPQAGTASEPANGPAAGAGPAAGGGPAMARAVVLWQATREKLPYLALAAAGAAATLWAAQPVRALNANLTLGARLAAAAYGLSFYLHATLVPIALPFFIPWRAGVSLERPEFALRAVLVVALAALLWALRKRLPAALAAFAAYLAWVLPVSGLLQAGPQLAAHRYSYLACLPWALLAGAGVARLAGAGVAPLAGAGRAERARRTAVAMGLTVVTALLVTATRREAGLWHDPLSFSRAAVASAPTAWLPRYLLARSEMQAGHWREAADQVRAGLRDTPDAGELAREGALLFATSPDPSVRSGEEALDLATQAADATGYQESSALYALAAAEAEAGDYAAAASTARDALADLDEPPESRFARSLAASIVLYQHEKPLRLQPSDWL